MSHINCPPVRTSTALLLALALTACGGGGSSGSSANPVASSGPAPAAPPPAVPAPGVACAPGDAPLVRANVFALVNVFRSTVGLPELSRLAAFDGTAQAHAQYLVANGTSGVSESTGLPCFTGVDLPARLAGAGLVTTDVPGSRTRIELAFAFTTPVGAEPQAWDLVNDTLNNLYGRMFLFDARSRQIGLGFSAQPGGQQRAMVFDTALLAGSGAGDSAAWAVWPRDGATELPVQMRASNVKPLDASLTEGYPVSLHAALPVQVSRFVLTNAGNGQAVEATLLTNANDRNAFLTPGEAALVPHAPLAAGSTYRVELDALVGATPLQLAWSFTTAR